MKIILKQRWISGAAHGVWMNLSGTAGGEQRDSSGQNGRPPDQRAAAFKRG